MTRLHELYDQCGQSPWLDNLRRDWITDGRLESMIGDGVRGITSNPTIFAKAIEGEDDYDEQFRSLVPSMTVEEAYWELVVTDIRNALALLAPLHVSSGGSDGFVSLEVAPSLAHDTTGTVTAARSLHERIGAPNLLVKVPGTEEGVPAVRQLIGEGRSINVTLIFGIDRYDAVMEAYISGLEDYAAAGADDLSGVHSVASFFVSRVDTEVDSRLKALGADGSLYGKAAVAQAKLAYELFQERFSGSRWQALRDAGAHPQRPLWASTSTKNPAYPDLLYVDTLIGPDTVNTMPDATVAAFVDHGTPARTVDVNLEEAHSLLDALAAVGVDMKDVSAVLEQRGVSSFLDSWKALLGSLEAKAAAAAGRSK